MLRRLASSRSQSITELLSDRFNHTRDRANDAFELRHLDGQLSAACCSQLVVTSPAVASRRAPLRGHPSLDEHPLQRGVQRAFFDLENVIRYPLNRIGDLISMHLAGARQSFQDQQIKCSWRNLVSVQGITPGIVRLWHVRIVSKACQGPTSVPGLYEKRAWKHGYRTDGRQPLPKSLGCDYFSTTPKLLGISGIAGSVGSVGPSKCRAIKIAPGFRSIGACQLLLGQVRKRRSRQSFHPPEKQPQLTILADGVSIERRHFRVEF